jgi:diphthamide biosynthesis enzyme Dph1/Dph2-like protein
MNFMLINAKYEGQLNLNEETIQECKKHGIIALYTSVQFLDKIEEAEKQLKDAGIEVISSQPDRAVRKYQLLGCDTDWKNIKLEKEADAFLYVGDGLFHPTALLLAQRNNEAMKDVIIYNPIEEKAFVMDSGDIKKTIKKYKGAMIKFMASDVIGVLITTKPGQRQYTAAKTLRKKYPNKQFYYFVDNKFDFGELENFPFIECWVNTACPRLAFSDQESRKPVINLNDALDAEKIMSQDSMFTRA